MDVRGTTYNLLRDFVRHELLLNSSLFSPTSDVTLTIDDSCINEMLMRKVVELSFLD